MSERAGFSREVCEAKEEMEKALARYVIGSQNLLRAFLATMEKSFETYSEFDEKLAQCIIQSHTKGSKERFREIMDRFDLSVSEGLRVMEERFESVARLPDQRRVEKAFASSAEDPRMVLDTLRGVPESKRIDNYCCRMDKIGTKKHFITTCLDHIPPEELKVARAQLEEVGSINDAGQRDRTAEDTKPPARYDTEDCGIWGTHGPQKVFRRKSV